MWDFDILKRNCQEFDVFDYYVFDTQLRSLRNNYNYYVFDTQNKIRVPILFSKSQVRK